MKARTRLTGLSFEAHVAPTPLVRSLSAWVSRAYLSNIPQDCFEGFLGRRLPEPGAQLVLSGDADFDGRLRNLRLFVRGPVSRLALSAVPSEQTAEVLVFDLRPGCTKTLLGVGASALCDLEIDLGLLWGKRATALIDRLAEARSATTRLATLEHELLAILNRERSHSPPLATVALDLVAQTKGRIPIRALAERLGVGERRLRRRFIDEVGLSPKACARISRFKALLHASSRSSRWAEAADVFGFVDQAHLIGEFRDFMGTAPGRFFAQEDFVPPLLPLGWLFTPVSAPVSDFSKTARPEGF